MLAVGALLIVIATISALIDLKRRAPIGQTMKRWARRVLDAIFSVP
jgi:hypothetical protein